MWWSFIIAGFGLGLVSSLHCVGMCGPLAMALPVYSLRRNQRITAIILHHLGRIVTYSLLGLVLGLAGRGFYMADIQQWFSIVAGLLIISFVISYYVFRKTVRPTPLNNFYQFVQRWMISIFKKQKYTSFFLFGIANGLLPCGMVYIAIAGAMTTMDIQKSVMYMAAFGLGTMPAMLALGFFGNVFSMQLRNSFRKAVPVFISIAGIILVMRGLNLGIPYLSPVLYKASAVVSCH